MITPTHTPRSPHIIPSDEESLSSKHPLPPSIDINCLPQPPTNAPPTEPRNETPHKNSVEPLSTCTINLVHKDATTLPPIPPSSTPEPFENRTQFKSLNLRRIFGSRQLCNQNHLTAATNASLVESGLIPSTTFSFATTTNPPKGKTNKKRSQYLEKVHTDIVFGDCVPLGGYRYALLFVDLATIY